jgi:hypothetical protein
MAGGKPRHKWATHFSLVQLPETSVEQAFCVDASCPVCNAERGWPACYVKPRGAKATWYYRGNGRRRWGKVMPPCLLLPGRHY